MLPSATNISTGVDGVARQASTALPKQLREHEVLLKITHSGLCHTDLEYLHRGVPLGHEGVGVVAAIGSEVTTLAVGDRAGSGYMNNTCGHCQYCLTGEEVWCYERNVYGESPAISGTFGNYLIGNESFLFKIPEAMESQHAAPMQCAGATVYNALVSNIKSGDRIGIIGIGGLGHLAIQFANKLGAETIVFSTTAGKQAEARSLGASEFYLLDKPEELAKPITMLLLTGAKHPDWSKSLFVGVVLMKVENRFMNDKVIARRGLILTMSIPPEMIELPGLPMCFYGYRVQHSFASSRHAQCDMLDFAARHGIKPLVEIFDMSEVGFSEATEKLRSGKVRYRAVLAAKD
ncbi:putative formaldehyde dehydrogenase [Hyphodiscus hymeniophilus]|uniref:Formaldehyde dehydrogenase n=1 Tax=Hyphodiscus hymeniophilus TaxID=353542 RepID=A0A9P6SKZ4_9HELO|nr:putative formaldehyde dehydrogenase [Hyphodiscus hymeniophilus]